MKEINADISIETIIEKIKNVEPTFLESNCDEKFLLEKYNYILTEQAKERLDKLYTYIKNGVPVILEGETGSSKTLSAEIICKYIYEMKKDKIILETILKEEEEKRFIKFN